MKKLILIIITLILTFNVNAQNHKNYNIAMANYLSKEMNGIIKSQNEIDNIFITNISPPKSTNQEIIILYINSLIYNTETNILSNWKRYGKYYKIKFIMDNNYVTIIKYIPKSNELIILTTNQ